MTEYIKCSRCHMKFINDDEHIKNDFGYNRLNERYKQCVRCRNNQANYRESHREEINKKYTEYYKENKEYIIKKTRIYNGEEVDCDVCGKTLTRHSFKKHRLSAGCKATANCIKWINEIQGDGDELPVPKSYVHGEFDGGIPLTEEEKQQPYQISNKTIWKKVIEYRNSIEDDDQ